MIIVTGGAGMIGSAFIWKLNEMGEKYSKEYNIPFLYADFKKKNRYLRSIEISKELDMYRQDYCGCIFSKIERENYEKEKLNKERLDG